MVHIDRNEIVQGPKTEPIKCWQVWFMTMYGPTPDIEQAKKLCEQLEVPSAMNIIPIPVAVSETMTEVNGGLR